MPTIQLSLLTVPRIPVWAVLEMNLQLPIMPDMAPTEILVVPVILCTAMMRLLLPVAAPPITGNF